MYMLESPTPSVALYVVENLATDAFPPFAGYVVFLEYRRTQGCAGWQFQDENGNEEFHPGAKSDVVLMAVPAAHWRLQIAIEELDDVPG